MNKNLTRSNKIDNFKDNGELMLDNGFVISKNLKRESLLSTKNLEVSSKDIYGANNYICSFSARWNDILFKFYVEFRNDFVKSVGFSFCDEISDEYSEEKELNLNKRNIKYLKDMLGEQNYPMWPYDQNPPIAQYTYDWGGVMASYDKEYGRARVGFYYDIQ